VVTQLEESQEIQDYAAAYSAMKPKHEDIGKFKRKDLRPAENLKPTFRTIRNYLAANAVGITRDEVFASQIINLIFCKIYDERFTRPNDTVKFRAGINEKDEDVRGRILELFEKVKHQYNDVIDVADSISLDAKCIKYIVGELQLYSLKDSSRDAVGEAFEYFLLALRLRVHKDNSLHQEMS
ncbi:N-6 DNA methylase, partial [human gut metagenome]